MAYEVEIKAHADEGLKEKIDAYTSQTGLPVIKEDTYYAFPGDVTPRFRIRRENDFILISAKRNHREGGLECNEELEFRHDNTDDQRVMEDMAALLGYEVFIHKYKRGWSWMYGPVHIELLDVRHLGWFLEMEIISDRPGFENNRENYGRLYEILAALGLDGSAVEAKSYQEMLSDWKNEMSVTR